MPAIKNGSLQYPDWFSSSMHEFSLLRETGLGTRLLFLPVIVWVRLIYTIQSRYLRACSPYIAVREYLKARKNDPNYLHTAKMDYLAPKEESQVPVNEADVVRASGQQLINSVNIVLHDIHHLDIKVLCSMDDMFSKIQEIELKMVM